jgi:hypothetical protein
MEKKKKKKNLRTTEERVKCERWDNGRWKHSYKEKEKKYKKENCFCFIPCIIRINTAFCSACDSVQFGIHMPRYTVLSYKDCRALYPIYLTIYKYLVLTVHINALNRQPILHLLLLIDGSSENGLRLQDQWISEADAHRQCLHIVEGHQACLPCRDPRSCCDLLENCRIKKVLGLSPLANYTDRPPLWSSGQSSWLQNGDVLCFLWGTNWICMLFKRK